MFSDEEFNNLVKTYMDTVFRLALNYVKCYQTAEDITQNVFIKLFHSNKSFESENHIRYWLIRVTINECKKILLSPWRKMVSIEEYINCLGARIMMYYPEKGKVHSPNEWLITP
jgi:RNA polymerase sigma-70 factor (ECF subfamily)